MADLDTVPRVMVETITPQIARAMLANSVQKEGKAKSFRDELVERIKAGLWVFDGNCITIDTNGLVTNGHTRLEAIAIAGIPVRAHVMRGVDPAVYEVQDSGVKRNASHIGKYRLGVKGRSNALAAIARNLSIWCQGSALGCPTAHGEAGLLGPCTNAAQIFIHESGIDWARLVGAAKRTTVYKNRFRPALSATIYFIAGIASDEDSYEFADQMANNGFASGTRSWALRNNLEKRPAEIGNKTNRLIAAALVRAMDDWREGNRDRVNHTTIGVSAANVRDVASIWGVTREDVRSLVFESTGFYIPTKDDKA